MDIDNPTLTKALRHFTAYQEKAKPQHVSKQMAAWSKRRDHDSLQRVLCCPLGDVLDVWAELKDIV